MKTSEIILLNYMKYNSKKDKSPKTMIQFAFKNVQETKRFNGVAVLNCYYDGHDVYDKLNKDMILKTFPCELELKDDLYDPLSTKKILKKIGNVALY